MLRGSPEKGIPGAKDFGRDYMDDRHLRACLFRSSLDLKMIKHQAAIFSLRSSVEVLDVTMSVLPNRNDFLDLSGHMSSSCKWPVIV